MSKRTYSQAGMPTLVRTTKPKRRKTAATTTMTFNRSPLSRPNYNRLAVEKKYWDGSPIDFVGNATGGNVFPTLIAGIVQGTTDNTRIGGKICVTNVNCRGFRNMASYGTAAFFGGYLRVVLYIDKQCNGANALVTDILQSATINAFRNMNNLDRFIILKDKMYKTSIDATNALHTDTSRQYWKINTRGKWEISFSGNTGGIADLRSLNIGMFYITSDPNVQSCSLGRCRIKYYDM